MLRTNNEPLRMFAELERLGELAAFADVTAVPALEDLETDRCYLNWQLELRGEIEKRAIDEVFDWVDATSTIGFRHVPGATPAPRAEPAEAAAPAPAAAEPAPVARPAPATPAAAEPAAQKAAADAGSIRVSTTRVDLLINLVGELVIT